IAQSEPFGVDTRKRRYIVGGSGEWRASRPGSCRRATATPFRTTVLRFSRQMPGTSAKSNSVERTGHTLGNSTTNPSSLGNGVPFASSQAAPESGETTRQPHGESIDSYFSKLGHELQE